MSVTVGLPTELCIHRTAWYSMEIPLLLSNSHCGNIYGEKKNASENDKLRKQLFGSI